MPHVLRQWKTLPRPSFGIGGFTDSNREMTMSNGTSNDPELELAEDLPGCR
jgi:hypothetical protein